MPRRQWQENSFYLLFGTIADVDREKLDLCLPEMDFLRGDTHKKKVWVVYAEDVDEISSMCSRFLWSGTLYSFPTYCVGLSCLGFIKFLFTIRCLPLNRSKSTREARCKAYCSIFLLRFMNFAL